MKTSNDCLKFFWNRFEGYQVPKKSTINDKRKLTQELKQQLEKNPDYIPKSDWIFVQLPLVEAHQSHEIPMSNDNVNFSKNIENKSNKLGLMTQLSGPSNGKNFNDGSCFLAGLSIIFLSLLINEKCKIVLIKKLIINYIILFYNYFIYLFSKY